MRFANRPTITPRNAGVAQIRGEIGQCQDQIRAATARRHRESTQDAAVGEHFSLQRRRPSEA